MFGGIKKRASTLKGNALITIADENIHPLYSIKCTQKCKARRDRGFGGNIYHT